jgi:organic hydroperoxide reductase OsmC/OhrA
MKPLPHRYDVHLTGGAVGRATVSADGMPALPMAPPVDFGGPGDAWSPEHLLMASVQACFLFTLRAVARHSHLTFIAVELDTTGTLDRQDGVTRFTDIVLRAQVTVPAGTDLGRVREALEKSKKACLISASLLTPVRIEPTVVERHADDVAA